MVFDQAHKFRMDTDMKSATVALKERLMQSWIRRIYVFGISSPERLIVYAKHPKAAKLILKPLLRVASKSTRLSTLLRDLFTKLGLTSAAKSAEITRINRAIRLHVKRRQYYQTLLLMAQAERTSLPVTVRAGEMIVRKLYNEHNRDRIREMAERALVDYPDSVFLLHLATLCQAMNGDSVGANAVLMKRLQDPFDQDNMLDRTRFRVLRDTWRVVDLTARERMEWLEPDGDYSTLKTQTSAMAVGSSANAQATSEDTLAASGRPIDFREHALQGRLREDYLESCYAEFKASKKLTEQVRAITEMLRVGIRHIPHYGESYDLARVCLEKIGDDIAVLLEKSEIRINASEVRLITRITGVLAKVGITDKAQLCVERLEALSRDDRYAPALWPALPVLAGIECYAKTAQQIAENIEHRRPKRAADIRDYLRYIALTGQYNKADVVVAKLSGSQRRQVGMLQYGVILQRQGRLQDALNLTQKIHGQLLADPLHLQAYTSYTLFKRIGELKFLIETAKIYRRVPQPKYPRGVVLITPRNIDHLRRYPILVLREFKRLGWAVVPLVEGLLPKELTGVPEIDVLNGAIHPTSDLSEAAATVMPELTEFNFDASKGYLEWRGMALSHPLWEDAAINRRRYHIDHSCPRLQEYLTGLSKWTQSVGRVLEYANDLHKTTALPVACHSLVNSRLPDALFRFYCEKFGSPDGFFFVHGANGYQNYFTNFSTNVSRRYVLRNMTKAPETRSASFPIPANFERYYESRKADAADILAKFEDVTKVKRSTVGQKTRLPEAQAAEDRIKAWRARGGKVACAFGKVVCDSGVPFDGGTAHANMKDWINHSIASVQGSDTLLLIKPHPHELNDQISTFPTEYFKDLIEESFGENVIFLGHHWFDIHDMKDLMDIGLIYNGTTAVELGLLGIPCLLSGHFSAMDYPIGHMVPETREAYRDYVRFEKSFCVDKDLRERAAIWLEYMASEEFTQDYRFHTRPVTNKVMYPPWWIEEDVARIDTSGPIQAVEVLAARALGMAYELGGDPALFPAATRTSL